VNKSLSTVDKASKSDKLQTIYPCRNPPVPRVREETEKHKTRIESFRRVIESHQFEVELGEATRLKPPRSAMSITGFRLDTSAERSRAEIC